MEQTDILAKSRWIEAAGLEIKAHECGSEKYFVIPGVADTPEDWAQLAEHLKATVYAPRNPMHRKGKEAYKNWGSFGAWKKKWISQIIQAIRELGCTKLIAHSGGNAFVRDVDEQIPLEGLFHLAPVVGEQFRVGEIAPSVHIDATIEHFRISDAQHIFQLHMMHALLFPLCTGLGAHDYRQMLARHWEEYGMHTKDIGKHEAPDKTGIIKTTEENLAIDTRAPATIIIGARDPFYLRTDRHEPTKEKMLKTIISSRKTMAKVFTIDAAHYPHVEQSKNTAKLILGK